MKSSFRFIRRWPKDKQCGYGRDSNGRLKFVFIIEADKTINHVHKAENKMFKFITWLLPEVDHLKNVYGKDQSVAERKEERLRHGRKYGLIMIDHIQYLV